jgi:hypothetical protein
LVGRIVNFEKISTFKIMVAWPRIRRPIFSHNLDISHHHG